MNKVNGTKGFTLIELVMAIAIIGLLAAIAIPRFIDLSGDATAAAKKRRRPPNAKLSTGHHPRFRPRRAAVRAVAHE